MRLAINALTDADLHRLHQIARGLTKSSVRFMDADDLMNTVVTKLIEGERTIRRGQEFVPAVARIMESVVSNEKKLADNKKVIPLDDVGDLVAAANSPEDEAVLAERRRKALALFRDSYILELVFESYYLDDMQLSEIAQLLEISQTAVESHLKTIKRRLRAAGKEGNLS